MTLDQHPELARLGDDLERAAGAHLATRGRRTRTLRAATALAALALMATATATMAGLFSPKQVAAGLPASAVIFGNTHPVCSLDADGSTYHCALDVPPQDDSAGTVTKPGAATLPTLPQARDFTGRKEPLAIEGVVAGGCIGRSVDGLSWDCYVGPDAVTQEIISQDFLGEPMTGPGRG